MVEGVAGLGFGPGLVEPEAGAASGAGDKMVAAPEAAFTAEAELSSVGPAEARPGGSTMWPPLQGLEGCCAS